MLVATRLLWLRLVTISVSPLRVRGQELMVDFFGVPGTAAGSADVFVIHCMSLLLAEDVS
jgi:hypothetical protein